MPFPFAALSPSGQSTLQYTANKEPVDAWMVVPLMPGQGFSAMPVVPEVTGAEDVVEAVMEDEDVLVGCWVLVGILVLHSLP